MQQQSLQGKHLQYLLYTSDDLICTGEMLLICQKNLTKVSSGLLSSLAFCVEEESACNLPTTLSFPNSKWSSGVQVCHLCGNSRWV